MKHSEIAMSRLMEVVAPVVVAAVVDIATERDSAQIRYVEAPIPEVTLRKTKHHFKPRSPVTK